MISVWCERCNNRFSVSERDTRTTLCPSCLDDPDVTGVVLPYPLSRTELATTFEVEITRTYTMTITRDHVGTDEEWRELIAAYEKGGLERTTVFEEIADPDDDDFPDNEDVYVQRRSRPIELDTTGAAPEGARLFG